METALVVHLVAPEAPVVGSGWDAPDGSVRHIAASWREMPATIADADVVIAHGVPALVVAQLIADAGPCLVYRPTPASTLTRKRGRRLHASWVAAPDKRSGQRAANALGLEKECVVPVRDAERADWNALVQIVLHNDGPATPDDLMPGATRRTTKWVFSRFAPSGPPPEEKVLPAVAAAAAIADDHDHDLDVADDAHDGAADDGHDADHHDDREDVAAAVTPEPATVTFPGGRLPEPESFHAPPPAPVLPNIIAASRGSRPARLDVGAVDPSSPGQPWWRYRRMELPEPDLDPPDSPTDHPPGSPVAGSNGGGTWPPSTPSAPSGPTRPDAAAAPPANSGSGRSGSPPATGERTPDPDSEPDPETEARRRFQSSSSASGVPYFLLGAAIIGVVVVCAQNGKAGEAPYLIPLGGFFLTVAAARRITRNHPTEPWVGRWLILGFFAKLVAAYIRYYTLTVTYNGAGDASADYDRNGRDLASAWLHGTRAPVLPDLRETNFIRWFTGVVYYIFGSSLLAGTFVFALLALIGSYFWYRATVEAVPTIDKKLYLGFVLFAPSIVFWPALVGKEALMQLGLGTFVLGVAFMLRQRLFPGLPVAIAGGWLIWVVRPHLLAIVSVAAGAAYLAGRVRGDGTKKPSFLTRPAGIILVAFLIAFTVGQGAKFLGLKDLSISSIQTELDATTAGSAQGGSQFKSGHNSLSPLNLPNDVITVFFRPFPWEIDGSLQIFASIESMILAGLVVVRFKSLRLSFSRSREMPFLMMCWVLTILYAIAFSAFANFGLLVRQRSLVFAAVLVLVSIDPELERKRVEALPPREDDTAQFGAYAR